MKAAPTYLGRAGSELAKERLSQYIRYAEIVADQEASLETGDIERFEELGRVAAELRKQIGSIGPDDAMDAQALRVEGAAGVLQEALAANMRIQDRLSRLRHESADGIRSAERRAPQARRYLSDSTEAPVGRIDLKF